MRESTAESWRNHPGVVIGACVVAYLPFTLLGYGNDIDVPNVLRAGRSWIDDRDYQISRGPGAVVHEVATAWLDKVGGSVLVNLTSVAFAALALWAVHRLVAAERGPWPTWAILVLASNPWFWIGATSLGDFTWALGLMLAGAVAARSDRRLLAGLLFGLAIGCRASTVVLVLAWLAAEALAPAPLSRRWRPLVVTLVVTLVVALVCFVPPWLSVNRSLDFLDNELDFAGLRVQVGRWVVKNAAVVGLFPAVVLLAGLRRFTGALSTWSTSVVVRFAVLSIVGTELLFFRFPFKPLHLLPAVAGVALLVGLAPQLTQRWLAALVVAQLLWGVLGVTIAAPDVPDDATTGQVEVGLTAGPLLTDVRCRLDDRQVGPWNDPASEQAIARAGDNAACQNDSWRAG